MPAASGSARAVIGGVMGGQQGPGRGDPLAPDQAGALVETPLR